MTMTSESGCRAPRLLVINAGGASRRMGGQTKALLPVPPHGRPLIATILARLVSLAPSHILVISNDTTVADAVDRAPLPPGRPSPIVLGDRVAGLGPLGGLWSALEWSAHMGWAGWLALVACDMPLLAAAPLELLFCRTDSAHDVVIPVTGGRYQPLHALYHTRCLSAVRNAVRNEQLKLTAFFDEIRVKVVDEAEIRRVDPGLRSLVNVNTPEEWTVIRAELDREAKRGD